MFLTSRFRQPRQGPHADSFIDPIALTTNLECSKHLAA